MSGADAARAAMNTALVARAEALRPLLRSEASQIERTRRLSAEVLAALHDMQAFNLQLTAAYGGPEADPLTHLRVIEALSRGDASSGWVAMVGSESSACINAFLAPAVIRRMLVEPAAPAAALTVVGSGKAARTAGGYRVDGHWRFASGARHAGFIGAFCVVHDGATPLTRDNGAPLTRMVFAPACDVEFHDTWHTSGLCGTASDDFALSNVFIPEECTADLFGPPRDPSPVWRLPISLRFAMSKAAATCGMARGAMDALLPLLERTPFAGARAAREEPRAHLALAAAEAAIEGGRAFLYQNVERAWAEVCAGTLLDVNAIAAVRLAIVFAARRAHEAVQLIQELGGTAAAFDAGLDRAARDLAVARHHLQLQPQVMEDVGRVLLGMAPRNPLF